MFIRLISRAIPILLLGILISCEQPSKRETGKQGNPSAIQTSKDSAVSAINADTIVLHEKSLNGILLPFPRKEMITLLQEKFSGFTVTKETGQQDGPDYLFYSVMDKDTGICSFTMDAEDTLKLDRIYIEHPTIKDQYGLKVGDDYSKIKSLRKNTAKTYTNPHHQHTFVYFDNSNIMYEISGDVFLPDTVDLENLSFTEEQIKDWTIDYVIWQTK